MTESRSERSKKIGNTLCFISRVIWIEKSSLSWCNDQFFILGWQIKEWTIPNKLSGENSPILCQNGAIATFMVPPRKYECVPDWYKNLHFRPLLISMHKRSINLIEGYTRNAFLVFEWRLLIVICADLALLWRNSIYQKNCISQYISLVPLYWKLVIPFKWTWFFKCLWHELWNIVYKPYWSHNLM